MNDVSIWDKLMQIIIINGELEKRIRVGRIKCRNFSSGRIEKKNFLKKDFSCILEVW